jgi:hypothetical protein
MEYQYSLKQRQHFYETIHSVLNGWGNGSNFYHFNSNCVI